MSKDITDQILSNLVKDGDYVPEEDEVISTEELADFIVNEFDVTEEEAIEAALEVQITELQPILDNLVREGYLEITGEAEDGSPLYAITEKGEQIVAGIQLNDKKDPPQKPTD